MAKGLGFEALVASPDEKRVAREKLLGRNLLPYLNKTDKKSVTIKRNLSKIDFD